MLTIRPSDDSSAFCGKCHTRGGDNGVTPGEEIIEASGGFIKHHEQYDEWYHSGHNSAHGPGCNDCHMPDASKSAIKNNIHTLVP